MDAPVVVAVMNDRSDVEAVQCLHTAPQRAPEPHRTVRVIRDRDAFFALMQEWDANEVRYDEAFIAPEWWPSLADMASHAS